MNAIDLYDFETIIETGAKSLLTAEGFVVFSSTDILVDRPVPRVEVRFQLGEEADHHEWCPPEQLANAWRGTLDAQVITATNDVATLRDWRARVREAISHWETALDAVCPNLSILYCRCQGATTIQATDKGYIACTITYAILFGLEDGALAQLEQSNVEK